MEVKIPEKLHKLKYPFLVTVAVTVASSSVFIFAPSLLTVLSYFWPLLVSTLLFLGAVVFFANTSTASPGSDSSCFDKTGEVLLDFVAGQPELPVEGYKPETE